MNNHFKRIASAAFMMLVLLATSNGQDNIVYTKYVNTFIGTAPLNDLKVLGYELPKGWRSRAGLTFPGSLLPMAGFSYK